MDDDRVIPEKMCYIMGIDYPIPMKMVEDWVPGSQQFNGICASEQGRRQTPMIL